LRLIDEALSLAEEIVWAVDQPGGSAALLLALLWEHRARGCSMCPRPQRRDRARDAYRGESKTDARDARVIAYPKRECVQTYKELRRAGERELAELQLLLARRRDLVTDQTRSITRLIREALLSLFPALERALGI
jgi:hypothetical protein